MYTYCFYRQGGISRRDYVRMYTNSYELSRVLLYERDIATAIDNSTYRFAFFSERTIFLMLFFKRL